SLASSCQETTCARWLRRSGDHVMSEMVILNTSIHLQRGRKDSRQLRSAQADPIPGQAPRPEPGRIPRVARLTALALKLDMLLRAQVVADLAALARLGQVSRARISQKK